MKTFRRIKIAHNFNHATKIFVKFVVKILMILRCYLSIMISP